MTRLLSYEHSAIWSLSVILLGGCVMSACATGGATTTASERGTSVATNPFLGAWEGEPDFGQGPVRFRLEIRDDGTWEGRTPRQIYTGVYRLLDDHRSEWKSMTTGSTGTLVLRQAGAQEEVEITVDGIGKPSILHPVDKGFGR